MAEQTILIMIAVAAVLALLMACPSQARIWEAIENYAGDRKHAHLLISTRQAARRTVVKHPEPLVDAPAQNTEPAVSVGRKRLFA